MANILTKDSLRLSVEAASGGNMTVMYDVDGNPSFMVRVNKFNLEDIDPALGTGVHPAFKVNGQEIPCFWVGAYLSSVKNNKAYSLPGELPKNSISYEDAKSACTSKGPGWHLMTVHERAALLLLLKKSGAVLRGNTNYGRSFEAPFEVGTRVDGRSPGNNSYPGVTLTGSGPKSWRLLEYINDFKGNLYEWIDCYRLLNGEIFVPEYNDFNISKEDWPSTSLFFDSPNPYNNEYTDLGAPIISGSVTNYANSVVDNQNSAYNICDDLNNISIGEGVSIPLYLKALCLFPLNTSYFNPEAQIIIRNYGERLLFANNCYANMSLDVASYTVSQVATIPYSGVGFRLSHISTM